MGEWKDYSCVCDNDHKTRGDCPTCTENEEERASEHEAHLAHIGRIRSVMKGTGMSSFELLNNGIRVK